MIAARGRGQRRGGRVEVVEKIAARVVGLSVEARRCGRGGNARGRTRVPGDCGRGTHGEDVVIVVAELFLGEELKVLGLRVEAQGGLHGDPPSIGPRETTAPRRGTRGRGSRGRARGREMCRRAVRRDAFDACRRGTSAVRAARTAVRAAWRGRRSERATTLDTTKKRSCSPPVQTPYPGTVTVGFPETTTRRTPTGVPVTDVLSAQENAGSRHC